MIKTPSQVLLIIEITVTIRYLPIDTAYSSYFYTRLPRSNARLTKITYPRRPLLVPTTLQKNPKYARQTS